MADYYPLLERAVSSLPESTPETRRAIYERARKALLNQLRNVQPSVPESYINRENQALNLSIAQLEAALQRAAGTPAGSAPGRPPQRPMVPGQARQLPPVDAYPPPSFQPPRAPAPTIRDPEPIPEPTSWRRPEVKPELRREPAMAPDSQPAPLVPPPQDDDGTAADGALQRFGRARADQAVVPDPDEDRREGRRPVAIAPPQSAPHPLKRIAILGFILLLATLAVAALAIRLKDNPQDYARSRTPTGTQEADAEASAGKMIDRVGSDQTGRAGAPTPAPAPAPAPEPTMPVAQRAAILVEAPDDPQKVKTFVGTSVWRIDNSGPQPILVAEIDLPDAKLNVVMRMARNTDPKLPASHTMEFRFTPGPGSEAPGVTAIDTPQMRIEDSANGTPLAGVPAAITPNYFLVGLSNSDVLMGRNMELLKDRGWFDVPMVLSTGRIAKLTFEKGASGDSALAQAMQGWEQQSQ